MCWQRAEAGWATRVNLRAETDDLTRQPLRPTAARTQPSSHPAALHASLACTTEPPWSSACRSGSAPCRPEVKLNSPSPLPLPSLSSLRPTGERTPRLGPFHVGAPRWRAAERQQVLLAHFQFKCSRGWKRSASFPRVGIFGLRAPLAVVQNCDGCRRRWVGGGWRGIGLFF